MNSFLRDVRVAARQLASRPGFALVVVITLALGIGAATTCFALLNGVALKAIPFADPDRLVGVRSIDRDGAARLALERFTALERTRSIFSGAAAYDTRAMTVAGNGVAERVQAADISADVFSLLGVPLQRGRALTAAD